MNRPWLPGARERCIDADWLEVSKHRILCSNSYRNASSPGQKARSLHDADNPTGPTLNVDALPTGWPSP